MTSGTAIEVERLIQLGEQIKNTELVDLAVLITQLEEEQAAETSQHEWCNTEKETGVSAQQDREGALQGLKSSVEAMTTEIAQLKTVIMHLQSEIDRVNEET